MAQKWTRVKDKRTGHEYSVVNVQEDKHTVIEKPAVNRAGRPLPAKPNVKLAPAGGPVAEGLADPGSMTTTETPATETRPKTETKKEGSK